jgi:hypothetical protein
LSIRRQAETVTEQPDDVGAARSKRIGLEQLFLRLNAEIVRDVEDMRDQRELFARLVCRISAGMDRGCTQQRVFAMR